MKAFLKCKNKNKGNVARNRSENCKNSEYSDINILLYFHPSILLCEKKKKIADIFICPVNALFATDAFQREIEPKPLRAYSTQRRSLHLPRSEGGQTIPMSCVKFSTCVILRDPTEEKEKVVVYVYMNFRADIYKSYSMLMNITFSARAAPAVIC